MEKKKPKTNKQDAVKDKCSLCARTKRIIYRIT